MTPVIPGKLYEITVHCAVHNYTWQTTANHLLNRNEWCPYCAKTKLSDAMHLSPEAIQRKCDSAVRPHRLTLVSVENDREGIHSYAEWSCAKHGRFSREIALVLYKNHNVQHGCPFCDEELHPSSYRRLGRRSRSVESAADEMHRMMYYTPSLIRWKSC
jgi:hypothetical protein